MQRVDWKESRRRSESLMAGSGRELHGYDPIDGELCLGLVKPGETLVEAISCSDVQLDGRTWA